MKNNNEEGTLKEILTHIETETLAKKITCESLLYEVKDKTLTIRGRHQPSAGAAAICCKLR